MSVGDLVVKNAGWLLVPDPDSKDEFVRMRGYQVSYLFVLEPPRPSPCLLACLFVCPHMSGSPQRGRKQIGEREEKGARTGVRTACRGPFSAWPLFIQRSGAPFLSSFFLLRFFWVSMERVPACAAVK